MPLYFFDVVCGPDVTVDDAGTEFESFEAARNFARQTAFECMDRGRRGRVTVTVRDRASVRLAICVSCTEVFPGEEDVAGGPASCMQ